MVENGALRPCNATEDCCTVQECAQAVCKEEDTRIEATEEYEAYKESLYEAANALKAEVQGGPLYSTIMSLGCSLQYWMFLFVIAGRDL